MLWLQILSWGTKALPLFKSWKGAGVIVLVVALGANYWYIQHLQGARDDARDDKATYLRWYQDAADANATCIASNNTLRGANESLAAAIRISEDERVAAVKEAAERTARANAQLDDTLESLEDLRNETPSCAELSKIDMGAVCPAVTERLRKHAAGTVDQD